MRHFNTTGPIKPARHYCVPPLDRVDLDDWLRRIREGNYFVLHAPRQSGKTSTLLALRDLLNANGAYRCVFANFECGQSAREDVEQAVGAVLGELASRARVTLKDRFLYEAWPGILAKWGPHTALKEALTLWAEADPKPLILLIDEIDALQGDSLVSVLRQLRGGYDLRPGSFPQSVVLCGLRDVRDYRTDTGSSPFNLKAESLRLGDFSRDEVAALLGQHTAETGQPFSSAALETVWGQTQGQPWLVNALAHGACFRSEPGRDRSRQIEADDILEAREQLILRRETHLDQLTDKLSDPRVQRVIEPLLSGGERRDFSTRDIEYVRDLGLIALDDPLQVANPIYGEAIPRELTSATQSKLVQDTAWYVGSDGNLDLPKLLAAFQAFFRQHSEHWVEGLQYKEAGPQLLLQAFLQRVVNSGGRVEREYGWGRGRTDLLVFWPRGDSVGRFVIECKIRHQALERAIAIGVEQAAGYMARCAAEEGHLVIFDRDEDRGWAEKVFHRRVRSDTGAEIAVWGM